MLSPGDACATRILVPACRLLTALTVLWSVSVAGDAAGFPQVPPDGTPAPVPIDDNPLALPVPDALQLRILTPVWLELTLITTKAPDPARVGQWDFVDEAGRLRLPAPSGWMVSVQGQRVSVERVGFKRRVVYAPLAKRDLRIGNSLFLRLAKEVPEGERVEVRHSDPAVLPPGRVLSATMDSQRYSPAIHVNQVGYVPSWPKRAMVGYYLGNLGDLELAPERTFKIVELKSGQSRFQGRLVPRRDIGFPEGPGSYQNVFEADFSECHAAGEYRLVVDGLGASRPFFIEDGVTAAFARTYALGLYHQRCGTNNALPFTRFVHGPCHTAPARIPTERDVETLRFLAEATANVTNNSRHMAPRLKDLGAALYPFVRQGTVDVAGGHHDAGDYSKYTINSAGLINALVFAVDVLPGVAELDNLGLPESGDGTSDLLQEARWEAQFLAKLQDEDGGVYFLVYPEKRKYENNVLPDHGDPQVVWPKNTAATAATVAALAQIGSSPAFKKAYPQEAKVFLSRAMKGWAFLERAIKKHGAAGAYQQITHYGNEFMHDDELAWAAAELYLATGDSSFQRRLGQSFDPSDPHTRRWGWWRLYECYGRAIRSYAFAVKSGKAKKEQLNEDFLRRCEDEIAAAAEDALRWAQQSAYGTSFPTETKRRRAAGWYFSLDQAYDLAVASCLPQPSLNDRRPRYLDAILTNLNYEGGGNPVNICFITGLGWQRPHEIVHHYANNDRRALPPSGLPVGNLQSGFMWLDKYKKELGAVSFPLDGAAEAPFPLYDRWGDSFNVQTEFVVLNQARALSVTAFLMAATPLRSQPWKGAAARIRIASGKGDGDGSQQVATLESASLDLRDARIVWEAAGRQPSFGMAFTNSSPGWIEAEAQWPDGRRVFGVNDPAGSGR
jgi:hypothetical protein